MTENTEPLLKRSQEKFKLLGEEYKVLATLIRKFANGEVADYSADDEELDDPARAQQWGDERTLQADWIIWLCTDPKAAALARPRGLRVVGAKIEGQLDLAFATIDMPLSFSRCAFTEPILFFQATIRGLDFEGTHVVGLSADGINVTGDIFLRDGFKAEGEVRLLGATIGSNLECDGSHFINPDGVALHADRMNVTGSVFLREGFKAKDEVRLLGATIGGQLDCTGGQFINPARVALNADGMNVTGGQFINPARVALNADGMNVKGSVFLREGFKAKGQVRLLSTTIGGVLDCTRGHFINPNGDALSADRMNVTGSVFLRGGCKAEGKVNLIDATVGIGLILTDIVQPELMTLDLRSATIGTLWDEEKSWPQKDKLHLSGLVYDAIDEEAPRDSKRRLQWLRLQPERPFSPQPYEQLAKVLRASGHEREAKKVLIGKQRDRRRHLTLPGKLGSLLLDAVIAHGYRPIQALAYVAVLVILGTTFFSLGHPHLFSATQQTAPAFDAFVYSIDVFLPIVDLHQERYWLPDANKGRVRWVILPVPTPTPSVLVIERRSGSILRYYLWFHISAGWILTSLWVAGLTGLVRKD